MQSSISELLIKISRHAQILYANHLMLLFTFICDNKRGWISFLFHDEKKKMSVVCEASGMLGQQYVESMVWEVSKWCMRSAVCCVSGVGSMVCMVSDM